MSTKGHRSIGHFLLKCGLAIYLVITGLALLGAVGSIMGNNFVAAIYEPFSGDLANLVKIVVGVLLLLCGVVTAIDIFVDLGKWDNIIMLVTTIVWIVIAILADVLSNSYGLSLLSKNIWAWLLNVSKDLLIIGGIQSIRD